jgi:hypothetical protein
MVTSDILASRTPHGSGIGIDAAAETGGKLLLSPASVDELLPVIHSPPATELCVGMTYLKRARNIVRP